jgi:DNA-binding beta-propeller fold protein YncE
MLKCGRISICQGLRVAASACLLIFLLASPLWAGGKKAAPPPTTRLGDQRTTMYFDTSKIVWPNPPAIPRIKYLDLFTGEKIDPSLYKKKQAKQKWMDRLAGAQTTDDIRVDTLPFQLIRAYGVGSDSTGKIYAADQGVGAVFVFDPEHKEKVELIANGKQAHFGEIVGLAMDDNDRLLVADAKLHRVDVFNAKHELEASFGSDVLIRPAGIAIDKENRFIYVADPQNDVVDVFDADSFTLLRKIGKPSRKHDATEPGLFSLPDAVAVDSDGNVYVTDTFNDRVEIFDADGNFINTFGKNGDSPADFQRPKGIAVDCDRHIWVVDAVQQMVKVFNKEGRLLIFFGGAGDYPGQFMSPWGIAVDKQNRVLVSETYYGRVQMFRYITDAEAEQMKKERETKSAKGGAPAPSETNAAAGKPAVNEKAASVPAATTADAKATAPKQ